VQEEKGRAMEQTGNVVPWDTRQPQAGKCFVESTTDLFGESHQYLLSFDSCEISKKAEECKSSTGHSIGYRKEK
jgi:hypothetical protein